MHSILALLITSIVRTKVALDWGHRTVSWANQIVQETIDGIAIAELKLCNFIVKVKKKKEIVFGCPLVFMTLKVWECSWYKMT